MFTEGCTEKMQKKKNSKQCKLPFSQTLPYPLLVMHYVPIKILVSKSITGKKVDFFTAQRNKKNK